MPAIEAQASGSRVLTSRGSAMAEFVDASTLLVDPRDTDAITAGLHEAYASSPSTPVAVVRRTWHDVAAETVAVYQRAQAELSIGT